MVITEAEADFLLSQKSIYADIEPETQVYFPINQKPDAKEIRFLKTIFPAMGWYPAQIRYGYLETLPTDLPEKTDPPLNLYFGFPDQGSQGPEVLKSGESVHIFMPKLQEILSHLPVKSAVWQALKPYSMK